MLTVIRSPNPGTGSSKHRLLALLLVGVASGQISGQEARAEAATARPARQALLIGINKYAGLPDLRGCVNDVEAMRSLLTSRFGFAPRNIHTLENEQATRQGILAALDALARRSGPNDTIFIFYAGHGSQVPDRNGDEKDDKLDESLVPHDGRTGRVRDITDDELDLFLTRFQTQSVIVVLDSCHSGTGTRSATVQARRVPADKRTELYPRQEFLYRKMVSLASGRHLLLTAAAADQCALDGPIDGRFRGFFSYALAKTLTALPPDAPARAVFAGVERETRRLGDRFRVTVPEPMMEGQAERFDRSLFPLATAQASRKAARVAWVEVGVDPSTRTAFLASAYAPGVATGAVWAIYPPGERDFLPGRSLAVGEVTTIAGGRAQLRVDPPTAPLQNGARAFLLIPTTAPGDLPICFVGLAPARAIELEKELQRRLPTVRAVGTADHALHRVEVTAREVRILGADGVQLVGSFPVTAGVSVADKLADHIQSSENRSLLASLDNPASSIRLDVRLSVPQGARKVARGWRGFKVLATTREPTFRISKPGDRLDHDNSLQVEIHCSTDCYITIVDVGPTGEICQLFPNSHARPDFLPEGKISAGRRVRIPDSLKSANRAGFTWPIAAPVGRDTIGIFASTDKETAQYIRRCMRGLEETKLGHPAPAAPFRELARLLATRGLKGVQGKTAKPTHPEGASDWTATSITYRIER